MSKISAWQWTRQTTSREAAGRKGRSGRTVPGAYFEAEYRRNGDPWNYAGSPYEAAKYAASIEALPQPRFRRALELGCSIGVFTRMLSSRCDELVAVDVSGDALRQARLRCADRANVRFRQLDLTEDSLPDGCFDLIAFCEIGFYFGPDDFARVHDAIAERLSPGGSLLLVHWTPLVDGHAQTADDVHEAFLSDARLQAGTSAREPTYRLDVLRRRL
jgi:SAM-dependent methyltransferase